MWEKSSAGVLGAAESGQRKCLVVPEGPIHILSLLLLLLNTLVGMPVRTYAEAVRDYAELRRAAYLSVEDEARRAGLVDCRVLIRDTDAEAVLAWRTWNTPHPSGAGGWNWEALIRRARRRPSALHLALWCGGELCGLAVGRASRRAFSGMHETVSLHFLEGSPDPQHPLRGHVAPLAIAASAAYGQVLGASRLRLRDPLPGALPLYRDLGFTIAQKSGRVIHCERRIPS